MIEIEDLLKRVGNSELQEMSLKAYGTWKEKMQYFPAAVFHHHHWVGGYHDHITEVMNIALLYYMSFEKNVVEIEGSAGKTLPTIFIIGIFLIFL